MPVKNTSALLLAWYDHQRRQMPWRAEQGTKPNPYYVWLSEMMLQQTTVKTVTPYFLNFIARFPTLKELANATQDEVYHAWQGLGYYSRARNLHRCSQIIMKEHNGEFPQTVEALLKLPGIGPYTSAAIASIAFEAAVVPVDGNVIRVISRLFALEDPLPGLKKKVDKTVYEIAPSSRFGDFAQALMDLGATICRPQKPACLLCPWQNICKGRAAGIAEILPQAPAKKELPKRYGAVFWLTDKQGRVLMRQRPPKGILANLMEFPSTPWQETKWKEEEALLNAPSKASFHKIKGQVSHTFTHFRLYLDIFKGEVDLERKRTQTGETSLGGEGQWVLPENFKDLALPTLMKKVALHVLS